MKSYAVLLGLVLVATASAGPLSGGPYEIGALDINAGGTTSTSASYELSASIGQAGGVGVITSASYKADDGFWRSALDFDPITLDLTVKNGQYGSVVVDPNWPTYPYGTLVTLTAEPNEGKQFKKWKIWDAEDPNLFVIDTNNPTTIDMDADRKVKAFFKCGGGGIEEGLPLLMVLGLLGLLALIRERL